jgi:hypothetical protein
MPIRSEKRTFEDQFIVDKTDKVIDELEQLNGLIDFKYDSVYVTKPTNVTELYTFKSDGDTVGAITITYEDSTKEFMVSAERG